MTEQSILDEADALETLAGKLRQWRDEHLCYRDSDDCADLLDDVSEVIWTYSNMAEMARQSAGDVARDTVNEARRESRE